MQIRQYRETLGIDGRQAQGRAPNIKVQHDAPVVKCSKRGKARRCGRARACVWGVGLEDVSYRLIAPQEPLKVQRKLDWQEKKTKQPAAKLVSWSLGRVFLFSALQQEVLQGRFLVIETDDGPRGEAQKAAS